LKNPLSRRLYRFLDKMTNYRPSKPYVIDIVALANKLGMMPQEQPAALRKIIKNAANELVERGWLDNYDFFKVGKFSRVRFNRQVRTEPIQLESWDSNAGSESKPEPEPDPLTELWATVMGAFPDGHFPPKLAGTRLLSIENGTATIAGGPFRNWIENRLGHRILKALQHEMAEITAVRFVE
jgi:hypothetical protein